MSRSGAILCLSLLSIAEVAAQGDGVTLLQSAGPVDGQTPSEMTEVGGAALLGTEKVASEMASAVNVLQDQVTAMHRDQKLNMEAQETMYTKKLKAQTAENQVISAANAVLTEECATLTKENAEKRAACKRLMTANDVLRANLTGLKKDIVLAMDFVNHSVDNNNDLNAPELQVLMQLDEADNRSSASKNHSDRLGAVAGAGQSTLAPKLSMLDGGRDRPHRKEDPAEKLLKGLTQSLAKLEEEGKAGAAKLKAHFMDQYKSGALEQSTLRSTQAHLNTTKTSLSHLGERLDVALSHLGDVHKQLESRVSSVMKFTVNMRNNKTAA